MLVSPHPEELLTAWELGITKVILPEFDRMMETTQETPHHMYNVGVHTVEALKHIRADRILRLTMLFHDMGKPEYKTMDRTGRHILRSMPLEASGLPKRFCGD